tara:strand:+ start:333 stop:623 length:291 start_codon:yes stop_codon:yes gene_type:complete
MFIALAKQKIQATIEITQKIVVEIFVNSFVDFKKPFAAIPRIIARKRKIYPDKLLILEEYDYLVILSTNFCKIGAIIDVAIIATGKLIDQAFRNLL